MATDATGTVTSPDNIPTYNTAADAPSGKGLNAIVAAIQAALSTRISAPAGIIAGEFPVWDGSAWQRAFSGTNRINNIPKVTTSTLAGGPPASPQDKDIWIATDVDANGTRWSFQYNAGSGAAYKWEFVGGPPVEAIVGTAETTTSAVAVDLATVGPSLTVARAGDYRVDWSCSFQNSGVNGFDLAGVYVGAANAQNINAPTGPVAGVAIDLGKMWGINVSAGGTVVKLKYSTGGGTATFTNRILRLTPTRIA